MATAGTDDLALCRHPALQGSLSKLPGRRHVGLWAYAHFEAIYCLCLLWSCAVFIVSKLYHSSLLLCRQSISMVV